MANFDWSKLTPKLKVSKYPRAKKNSPGVGWPRTLGVEFTSPWKREGLGVAVALGLKDFWLGWPKTEQIHTATCGHKH